MFTAHGYATTGPKSTLKPFTFTRRALKPSDVLIEILYSGICHSDIHQARNEWETSKYPMVPGHEIAGRIAEVGTSVKKFKVGDPAGVGCFVDSCRKCAQCKDGYEQFCEFHTSWTYNGTLQDKKTPTYGGYSNCIVVDEKYALKIPQNIPLAKAAPLLCAGITTYSPLRHFKVGKGSKVAIVGLGGLGHMGLKLAASFGAEVSVLSTSKSKEKDAKKFGAKHFYLTKEKYPESLKNYFDFILDTVSAPHDINALLGLIKRDGTLTLVGVPDEFPELDAFALIGRRRKIAGSLIGGISETQEMLNYCGKNNVTPEIEIISASQINEAYTRTLKGDVKYRFVIDAKTFG